MYTMEQLTKKSLILKGEINIFTISMGAFNYLNLSKSIKSAAGQKVVKAAANGRCLMCKSLNTIQLSYVKIINNPTAVTTDLHTRTHHLLCTSIHNMVGR